MSIERYAVLVVEDNPDTLVMISLTLESDGYKVFATNNPSTALDYLHTYNPDVMLVDLMLPEMTGLEFIRHVRRIANYDLTPIIAISAYDQRYLAAAIMAGADAALHKPEDIDRLTETIKEVLGRRRPDKVA
jgi:two-component system KDP operon response regulator KdpE